MNKLIKHEKGFTLIEILIAISLLAIIAAIVVPNLTGLIGRGQSQAYRADQKAIQSTVDVYYTDPTNRLLLAGQYIRQQPTGSGKGSDSPGYAYANQTSPGVGGSSYISFTFLIDQSLLTEFPASAAPVQNGSSAFTGNYGWYVDSKGRVQSSPAYTASIGYP